mmetsp:Transcript_73129/g.174258  ORF Transcript_73129/g.174258 Transcript_73129/m.174258 type:complete len:392 (+) Transcript_73129:91-1266(+)
MPAVAAPSKKWILILSQQPRCDEVSNLAAKAGFEAVGCSTTQQALQQLQEHGQAHQFLAAVVCALGTNQENSCWPVLQELKRRNMNKAFVTVFSHTAAQDPKLRLTCFDAGANMITESTSAVEAALRRVAWILSESGPYTCPSCGLSGLSEDACHRHMPFHHGMQQNVDAPCPICGDPCEDVCMEVHLNNSHGNPELREPPTAPFAAFSWCVCRRQDGRFLMVNEPAGISRGKPRYWLPAGRVDRGETLEEAACRECMEEGGVEVRVAGVLRFMMDSRGTLRVVFLVVPVDEKNAEAKSVPDWESCGALWLPVEDLGKLDHGDYRSPDPADLYPKVASGALKALSLDTPAFKALEELIQRFTSGSRRDPAEFRKVWEGVQKTYPASAFARD